jgi:hypothetical protein
VIGEHRDSAGDRVDQIQGDGALKHRERGMGIDELARQALDLIGHVAHAVAIQIVADVIGEVIVPKRRGERVTPAFDIGE